MLGGLLEAHKGESQYVTLFNAWMGNNPLAVVGNNAATAAGSSPVLSRHSGVAWYDWIPGDWGYANNRDPWSNGDKLEELGKGNAPKANGREGSNFFYVGGGEFKGFSGGSKPTSLEAILKMIWGWRYEPDVKTFYVYPYKPAPISSMIADPSKAAEGSLRDVRDSPKLWEFPWLK